MQRFEREKYIRTIIGVDGVIALLFGLVSLIFPREVFSSIVNITGANENSLIFSAFMSLSISYTFLGLICIYFAMYNKSKLIGFSALMAAYHAVSVFKNVSEINAEWLVGNPWSDIFIHFTFCILYTAFILKKVL